MSIEQAMILASANDVPYDQLAFCSENSCVAVNWVRIFPAELREFVHVEDSIRSCATCTWQGRMQTECRGLQRSRCRKLSKGNKWQLTMKKKRFGNTYLHSIWIMDSQRPHPIPIAIHAVIAPTSSSLFVSQHLIGITFIQQSCSLHLPRSSGSCRKSTHIICLLHHWVRTSQCHHANQ